MNGKTRKCLQSRPYSSKLDSTKGVKMLRGTIQDWRKNWRRYLVNALVLYVVFTVLYYLAQWFERSIEGMI